MATQAATDEKVSNGHDRASTISEANAEQRGGIDQAQEKIKEVQDQLQAEMRNMTETGTKFIKENPGTAVLGAVGLGLLIGLALKRD